MGHPPRYWCRRNQSLGHPRNFYGTTSGGGAFNPGGTIFKITPEGKLTTFELFCCGSGPAEAGLIQGADGNFYGTIFHGGDTFGGAFPWCDWGGGNGCGAVFEISPDGSGSTIYSFLGYSPDNGYYDGENPAAPLVQATDGNFYGTTINGGRLDCGGVTCKAVARSSESPSG